MLALPIETGGAGEQRYPGTLHMYLEAGFSELQVIDNMHVMWLDLR
jgi:hypothetical protein